MSTELNLQSASPICKTCRCFPCGCYDRRASSPAAVPEGALPPLPDPFANAQVFKMAKLVIGHPDHYQGEFIRLSDARAAVEADRAQRPENANQPLCDSALRAEPARQHDADARDAARYRWLCSNNYDRTGRTQIHTILHWSEFSKCGGVVEWQQRMRGGALDRIIDEEMTKGAQS